MRRGRYGSRLWRPVGRGRRKGTRMDRSRSTSSVVLPGRPRSRRSTLRCLGVGLAAAALSPAGRSAWTAAAQLETPAAEPPATPVVPPANPIPNLTGVAPLPLTGARLAAFEAYVAAQLAELGVPGAAVAVVQDGAVAFLQGFGVRALGQPDPVTADTLLR